MFAAEDRVIADKLAEAARLKAARDAAESKAAQNRKEARQEAEAGSVAAQPAGEGKKSNKMLMPVIGIVGLAVVVGGYLAFKPSPAPVPPQGSDVPSTPSPAPSPMQPVPAPRPPATPSPSPAAPSTAPTPTPAPVPVPAPGAKPVPTPAPGPAWRLQFLLHACLPPCPSRRLVLQWWRRPRLCPHQHPHLRLCLHHRLRPHHLQHQHPRPHPHPKSPSPRRQMRYFRRPPHWKARASAAPRRSIPS